MPVHGVHKGDRWHAHNLNEVDAERLGLTASPGGLNIAHVLVVLEHVLRRRQTL